MAELTKEQFDGLPDFIKGDYEADGEKYVPVAEKKVKSLKESLNGLDTKLKSFEQQQTEAIKRARDEALEEARTKGDVKEIEKRYQEQMADLKQRSFEEGKAQASKEFSMQRAQAEASVAVADIVTKLRPLDGSESMLKLIVQSRQKIGEDGKVYYTNADGGASVLDAAGLMAELQNDAAVKRLIQGQQPTKGGGLANGGSGGGASGKTMTRAQFSGLNAANQMAFVKDGGQVT